MLRMIKGGGEWESSTKVLEFRLERGGLFILLVKLGNEMISSSSTSAPSSSATTSPLFLEEVEMREVSSILILLLATCRHQETCSECSPPKFGGERDRVL